MENSDRTRETRSAVGPVEPALASQARVLSSPHVLCLAWKPDIPGSPAGEFAISIASYLFGVCHEVVAESSEHGILDDLDLNELVALIRSGHVTTVVLRTGRVDLAGEWRLDLPPSAGPPKTRCHLTLTVCEHEQAWTQVEWLQASFDHPAPMPTLAVPQSPGGVSISVCHSLVVLASRFGQVDLAELTRVKAPEHLVTVARWHFENSPRGAVPVIAHEGETLWLATTPPSAAAKPACWVEVIEAGTASDLKVPTAPDQVWQARFKALLAMSPPDGAELAVHLQQLVPVTVPFCIVPLHAAPQSVYMAPPQADIVCALAPTESAVYMGVDFDQAEHVVRQVLLHAYGHLLLGHVRPGDAYGHWDTAATLGAEYPHRRWGREVREHCAAWFQSTAVRKVASPDDCTPLEKAQLGLWRMIGEMLGERRRLHPLAERYQKAAYQRQAAQRMVATLEDYGGAMLCDGVGLGKTYVATTLMTHYVNTWKDQHAADPDKVRTDPFRITVLAPNSVVSTWQREAIPPLAAFGVPLATVRVASHTKLSRLTRTSELLQRSARDTLSDLEHLLLSDLIIVDEARNFRSVAARRTRVLRDLLRLQPRREVRRGVVLLTATPVNNSLEDLRQEAGLLFSRPLWLSDVRTDDGYRRQAIREVQDRCARARSFRAPQGDVAALVIHGQAEVRFSDTIEFRDDLDFGPNVQRIGDYLKEQNDKLKVLQDEIRAAARAGTARESAAGPVRIAEELLDRIVVQRSRALCKEIERQQGANVELLFRPDQGIPEKLYYADEYDGTGDVLARFLPLFDTPRQSIPRGLGTRSLSLKAYMWYDLREGIKSRPKVATAARA